MIPFYNAPALNQPPAELVVYVKEHTLKKPQTLQMLTIDFPDGMRVKYALTNQKNWQKITEQSRCLNPQQSVLVTLIPRKESARHSAISYTLLCEDIKNHVVLSFAQSSSGGITVKQTSSPGDSMKKAALLKR
ncbi:hypothetical protein [Deinococcus cellulosilyticus]|uniref:Uncharacterized protein n=1 Tax=Deinococcus cellulosilyticus (strain DSM 18568 / NBRC 106333 / KACC 11606 / 5516J-15) TaxID=1223518 RepID=A0A511N6Z3_DEIC1|nr:hypothetical protein [Deinococcus cellulosilyticus]GEM48247.1 hypothetical protein DC3_38820 [Deinococcus cellulosilyticus NBRC 106333 = KACC 11606]